MVRLRSSPAKGEKEDKDTCLGCVKVLWHIAGAEGKPKSPENKDLRLFPTGNTH